MSDLALFGGSSYELELYGFQIAVRHPLRSYVGHIERNIYEISHVESCLPCRGCVEGLQFVPEVSSILLVFGELQTFRLG